jgi:A/G-specific adenine glycosylase
MGVSMPKYRESEIEDYGVPRLIEIMLEKINPAE